MRKYPKYKESGIEWIGVIPVNWGMKKVKYLFEIRKRISGELGYDILSVTQHGLKVKDIISGEGQLSMDYTKYQLVYPDDFVMNHMDLLTGYVDISKCVGVTSPDYRVFTLIDDYCNKKYYLYILQFGYSNKIFYGFGQGSSMFGRWRLPSVEFNEFQFPNPPFHIQSEIVEFLDQKTSIIDNLVQKKLQKVKLLKELRSSLINQAVTKGLNLEVVMKDSGVEWIGEIPETWEVIGFTKALEDLADYRGRTPEKTDEGVILLTAKNIRNGKIDYCRSIEYTTIEEQEKLQSRGIIQLSDVIFTTEAPLGEVANIDNPNVVLAQRVIKFRGIKEIISNFYLKYWILSTTFQTNLETFGTGSTVEGIKASKLCMLKCIIPPLQEQNQIVDYLDKKTSDIDKQVDLENRKIDLLKEYRQSLISEVMTGKIDVRTN